MKSKRNKIEGNHYFLYIKPYLQSFDSLYKASTGNMQILNSEPCHLDPITIDNLH